VTRLIEGLSDLGDAYDVLLCDIWGVIHNGREAFAPACEALVDWRETRGPVVLISNSPRPARGVIDQLGDLNVPRACWSDIVTSGDVTRRLLAERAPGPAWRIGPDRDDPLYEGLGLKFSGVETARFIACSGPDDDEVETPEDYRTRLSVAARRGLEMVCANPDRVVQRGDRLIYCGGALAALYEALGGETVMAGKPFAPIYHLALAAAEAALGGACRRSRILAVGDGLATDIAGAQAMDLDRLFVAGGIHAADSGNLHGGLSAAVVGGLLSGAGLSAQFATVSLRW
jgi:HAD superfamily hydrolase (TIGR01459 family)